MSRPVTQPIGHEEVCRRLAALAEEARRRPEATPIAHAILFAGPEGVGKFRTAQWWAGRLKCADPSACAGDTCKDCALIGAGTHPDVTVVAPAEAGKAIGIDDVRELIAAMALRPTRPGPRIGIVREAQSLTAAAQSAMLKLLEEPPGFATLVLVTENASALFATLRSRCQTIRFGPLSADDVVRALVALGTEPDAARRAAEISGGSVGRAARTDDEWIAEYERLVDAVERAARGELDIDEVATGLVERRKEDGPGLEAVFEWQMRQVEASLGWAGENESDRLAEPRVGERAKHHLAAATHVLWALQALDRNGNPRLVMRELLLRLQES